MMPIDLNCDLGEGIGSDEMLMSLITSANIACGGHAGDEQSMRQAVVLAQKHGVAVGAHPGFMDREFFGRRELPITPDEVFSLVCTQVEHLRKIASSAGASISHVKHHGALYNQAARDPSLADAIARAVKSMDGQLILFGPAGSQLIAAGMQRGLKVAQEVFADRNYGGDGQLILRNHPLALIKDVTAAVHRVVRMLKCGDVIALNGTCLPIVADTLCVHGDGADPLALLQALRYTLNQQGINISAVGT